MADNNDLRVWGLQGLATALLNEKTAKIEGLAIANDAARSAKRSSDAAVSSATHTARSMQWRAEDAEKALAKSKESLDQKDALLKEWMHSNEAFKRLARKYGKKLGVSDEQRQNDYDDQLLEIAEEKPELANTDLMKGVKEVRGLK